jgi:hypothetical protein
VYGEPAGRDALALAGLRDELLGERGALVRRDHSADDVAAEYVEDGVSRLITNLKSINSVPVWVEPSGEAPNTTESLSSSIFHDS